MPLLARARNTGRKLLAVLLDPDHCVDEGKLMEQVREFDSLGADVFLIGGSLLSRGDVGEVLEALSTVTHKPRILFPGSAEQVHPSADGILFLSLISGRNAELLIGQHVYAAPKLSKMNLEVIPTGYMLIDGGRTTTAHYMSQSMPIPYDKDDIATATAQAGALLGLQCLYMDAGSGAKKPIRPSMIGAVRKAVDLPIIIGGGIRDGESAALACASGADMVVVGTALEQDAKLFEDISIAVHQVKTPKSEF